MPMTDTISTRHQRQDFAWLHAPSWRWLLVGTWAISMATHAGMGMVERAENPHACR